MVPFCLLFILAGWLVWPVDVKAPYRAELIHSKLSVAERQIRSIFAFAKATRIDGIFCQQECSSTEGDMLATLCKYLCNYVINIYW